MAQWIEFTEDHDHRWASRAVTAFKKGMKTYVKDEVAEPAIEQGKARPIDRPKDGDPAHVTTRDPDEGGRDPETGNSDPEITPTDVQQAALDPEAPDAEIVNAAAENDGEAGDPEAGAHNDDEDDD